MDFNKHLTNYLTESEINELNNSIREDNLKAVLLNLNKMDCDTFIKLFPNAVVHPVVKNAFIYDPKEYQLDKSIWHDFGCFYIQEPSAMVPAYLLKIKENDLVLDLCAAPGGKTIQTSLKLNDTGLIIANDLSRQRANIIVENIERLGLGNVVVINNDFSKIYRKYKNTFSKIVLDAPCSGSGMFKKDQKMIEDWSYNKVLKFAETQKELILMCYEMLKEGGEMVYSTCSFSYEEDEEVILYLLENTDAEIVEIEDRKCFYRNKTNGIGVHLLPHLFPGDGQYICLIKKPGTLTENKIIQNKNFKKIDFKLENFEHNFVTNWNNFYFSIPKSLLDISHFNILRFGLKIGEIKGKDFVFDFHFSRYLKTFKNEINLNEIELIKFKKGESISKETPKGFVLVKYNNVPISFGKSDGNIIKNHYPKHLRF